MRNGKASENTMQKFAGCYYQKIVDPLPRLVQIVQVARKKLQIEDASVICLKAVLHPEALRIPKAAESPDDILLLSQSDELNEQYAVASEHYRTGYSSAEAAEEFAEASRTRKKG
jgi:hypothetical protein